MSVPANWPQAEQQILAGIGAPSTPDNLAFLNAWANKEGANDSATNNPFNTTYSEPGATIYNSIGVRNYPTSAIGVAATIATLKLPLFADVVGDLRAGDASTTKSYYGLHAWSAGPNAPADKGYWSLTGVSHAVTPTAAQTAGGGASGTEVCRFSMPFPLLSNNLCMDKLVGGLAMAGGALLIFGGLAVMASSILKGTAAGRVASQAANAVPVVNAARIAKAATPAARQAKAETRASESATRRAPAEAERRRQEVHQTRQAIRARAGARAAQRTRSVPGPTSRPKPRPRRYARTESEYGYQTREVSAP